DDKQTALDPRVQLSLADLAMRRNDTAKALISYRQLLDNFINIQKQLQYLSHNTVQFVDDLLAGRGFGERINSVWLTSQSEIKPYLEQIVILQKISKQLNSLQAGYREILASKSNSLDAALILKQENSLKILKSRLVEINQQSRAVMLKEIPVLSLKWSSEANWLLVGAENGLMRGFLRTKFAKDKMLETIETVKINELSHINLNLGFLRGVEK
ncbi:MAG: hypothetical protein O2897_03690, partial [bacterium]|nr:hypothetical protein [bacterium]